MFNDFIFALIAHQWGYLGSVAVILLYILIIIGGLEIASLQPDAFGRLIAIGISTQIAVQMFINVGMTVGIMPITGIPLPLVSYGGSSVLSTFICIGLVESVHMRRHEGSP